MAASRAAGRETSRLGILGLGVVLALLSACDRGGLGFEPELDAAWVAVRPEGETVARVGKVELAAGTRFTLHAVIEAEDWRGRTFYYTEAAALEILGRPVPSEALRRWDRGQRARVLWFTVEGSPPYAEHAEITFREVFQADWALAWSVVGDLEPAVENYLPDREAVHRGDRFGTQRFMVRVEILGRDSEILPLRSLSSARADRLPQEADRFATVVATLPGALGPLSRVFGLPQREPSGPERDADQRRISEWLARDLAFSRLTLLRRWLDALPAEWQELPWETVELEGESEWVAPGEPLRVGERVVWLLEDRGVRGRLDREDLCLDFEQGARVLTLKDIFTGAGLVERARLGDRAAGGG